LKGVYIADVPIVVDAIDPCLSCSARITVTDYAKDTTIATTLDALRKTGRKRYGGS
jgi:Ni,Fe-hydrogenase III large subunit